MNRRISVVSRHDLKGPNVHDIVESFNRRLTRRMTFSRVGITRGNHNRHDLCLMSGVKVNFDVRRAVAVNNRVEFSGQTYDFITELKFSKNATVVVQMCSHQNVDDLLSKVKSKFNIVDDEGSSGLQLYERELSVSQQDIFFRKVEAKERPMEISFLWRLNNEKKNFIVTDHDPNATRYSNYSMDELEFRLKGLEEEEIERISLIESKYQLAKAYIHELLNIHEQGQPE